MKGICPRSIPFQQRHIEELDLEKHYKHIEIRKRKKEGKGKQRKSNAGRRFQDLKVKFKYMIATASKNNDQFNRVL